MSIQVRASEAFEQSAEAVQARAALAAETQKSAPEGKPSEHKETVESDPAEVEAEDTSKDDTEADLSNSEEEGSEDSDKDKPKKKGGFQRRIDKLNARISAREQELEYWKSQAMKSGRDDSPKEKVEAKQAPANLDDKPVPGTFDTHAEYVEALADWKIEQREKQRQASEEKKKAADEQQNLLKTHAERVKAFAEKTEDFMDALENLDDVPNSPAITELIVSSENGPALLYELAKNKSEALRIAKLPPLAAARELGKIESRIAAAQSSASSDPKPEAKKVTKAPKPLEPVGASSPGSAHKSIFDPNISQADYERMRREQIKRRNA